MVNIFEADHGEQTTTREGGGFQQYSGARTKFAFWLYSPIQMAFVAAIVI